MHTLLCKQLTMMSAQGDAPSPHALYVTDERTDTEHCQGCLWQAGWHLLSPDTLAVVHDSMMQLSTNVSIVSQGTDGGAQAEHCKSVLSQLRMHFVMLLPGMPTEACRSAAVTEAALPDERSCICLILHDTGERRILLYAKHYLLSI